MRRTPPKSPRGGGSSLALRAAAWDGSSIDVSWYNTTDTEFTISTPEQLAGLSRLTRYKSYADYQTGSRESAAGNGIQEDNFLGKTVHLGADLNMSNKAFTPISYYENVYDEISWQGVFDGAGHTIKNLYIKGTSADFGGYQGLIGGIGMCGVVKNLGVEGKIDGCRVGGIVASSNIDGTACALEGDTSTSTVMDPATEWPKIMNCYSKLNVVDGNGSGSRGCGTVFGGEGSYNSLCHVINCYSKGSVTNSMGGGTAGGIAGHQNGWTNGCYFVGSSTGLYDAALVGHLYQNTSDTYRGIGEVGESNMALSGSSAAGNVWRYENNETGSGNDAPYEVKEPFYTAAQMKTTDAVARLGDAYVADAASINGGYPVLFWQAGLSEIDMSSATLGTIAEQVYKGAAVEPEVQVTLNGKVLTRNLDYALSYEDNDTPGTGKVTAYGLGRYEGHTATATFTITATDIKTCSIADFPNTWSYGPDEPACPKTTVTTDSGVVLEEGTGYTLSYEDNVHTGTATVTIAALESAGFFGSVRCV